MGGAYSILYQEVLELPLECILLLVCNECGVLPPPPLLHQEFLCIVSVCLGREYLFSPKMGPGGSPAFCHTQKLVPSPINLCVLWVLEGYPSFVATKDGHFPHITTCFIGLGSPLCNNSGSSSPIKQG